MISQIWSFKTPLLFVISGAIRTLLVRGKMPIVRDPATGRQTYVSTAEYFRDIRPEYFFQGNDAEYVRRVRNARQRVLRAIRTTRVPLAGRGYNHEFRVDVTRGSRIKLLADFVDAKDGSRARRVRENNKMRADNQRPPGQRIRIPQDVKKRRSALFGGQDIPEAYRKEHGLGQSQVDRLVDRMRWFLIEDAIVLMYAYDELMFVGDRWYVPVSVMDKFRRSERRSRKSKASIKPDFRPFHGRPNRDRDRDQRPIAA